MESELTYFILGAGYIYLLCLSWTPETVGLMFSSKYWLPEVKYLDGTTLALFPMGHFDVGGDLQRVVSYFEVPMDSMGHVTTTVKWLPHTTEGSEFKTPSRERSKL